MANNKFDIIDKVVDLLDYTLMMTSNKKRYPPKYKEIVRYIVRINLDIFDCLTDANDLDIKTERNRRIRLQTKGIHYCDKLSKLAELSYRHKLIGSDTLCNWQKRIGDVKYMTMAWRKSDKER